MSGIDAGMGENTGRTVGRKSIVKLGLIREGVDFADVVKKEAPRIGGLSADSVQINVLWRILSVVGPYPDQITLVRNNIKQFVLLKETGDRRVASFRSLRVSMETATKSFWPNPKLNMM